jgi:uncharacterized protein (TIGR02598 family)
MHPSQTTRETGGFSLIEVTIAMAIASVALVTLIGLIPQGMDTMRQAGDQAIMGRIHQQILNEIQLTPFEDEAGVSMLDKFNGVEFYYDAQGEELSDSMTPEGSDPDRKKGSFAHIYSARISIPKEGSGNFPNSVGGGSYKGFSLDGKAINPNLRPVIVEVAAVGGLGETFDFDSESTRHLISTYQTMIVKMGQDYR